MVRQEKRKGLDRRELHGHTHTHIHMIGREIDRWNVREKGSRRVERDLWWW